MNPNKIIPIYRSRETMIKTVKPLEFEADLTECAKQTQKYLEALDEAVDNLNIHNEDYFDALYEYGEDNNDETEAGVQIAAMALEDSWAEVQQRLSEYAVLMSIEGNEAFQRKMD
jgi:hypothetical protein